MRLPHVRLTVRRMMIAVAIAAAVLGVVRLWQRRDYCLRRATLHARWETVRRADEQSLAQNTLFIAANLAQADADEHARLSSLYQRIAYRPWEAMPDEPLLEEPSDDSPFVLDSR